MKTFAFVVLGYARTELEEHGLPFFIALHAVNGVGFKIFLLREWESQTAVTEWERTYISDFIQECRLQHFREPGSKAVFFHSIEALSVGPIRTATSGTATLPTELCGQQIGVRSEDVVLCQALLFKDLLEALNRFSK